MVASRGELRVGRTRVLPFGVRLGGVTDRLGDRLEFVALFAERFADLPLILNGVMDPRTGAHGPDESMDIEVFRKAILANVYLYAEIADTLAAGAPNAPRSAA